MGCRSQEGFRIIRSQRCHSFPSKRQSLSSSDSLSLSLSWPLNIFCVSLHPFGVCLSSSPLCVSPSLSLSLSLPFLLCSWVCLSLSLSLSLCLCLSVSVSLSLSLSLSLCRCRSLSLSLSVSLCLSLSLYLCLSVSVSVSVSLSLSLLLWLCYSLSLGGSLALWKGLQILCSFVLPTTSLGGPLLGFKMSRSRGRDEKLRQEKANIQSPNLGNLRFVSIMHRKLM